MKGVPLFLGLALLGGLSGCSDDRRGAADTSGEAGPGASAVGDRVPAERAGRGAFVTVVFTREEQPAPVTREVDAPPTLERALVLLLAGPSDQEREAGLTSWFSARTAGALRSVSVTPEGTATVDLTDLRSAMPGASSSAGSAMLLQELTGTVFAFDDVASVTFTMDGSCDAFWNWLQRSCTVVLRGQIP